MKNMQGFTFIELLVFVVVTAILMSTILLGAATALRRTPAMNHQWVSFQLARGCMEWFLQQRRLNGYSSITCPSTPTATACTGSTGYSVTVNISCTTWNSDTAYKTIRVNVSGLAASTLSTQIGDY